MKNGGMLFFEEVGRDVKVFFFIWLLLNLYRVLFIILMREYLNVGTGLADILTALFYGARISLKAAGIAMLLTFVFVTLPQTAFCRRRLGWLRQAIGAGCAFFLSVLFLARFPYYEEFHAGFNQMVFNTFEDDIGALFGTFVSGYQLFPRLLAAILIAVLCHKLLRWWLKGGKAARFMPQVNGWKAFAFYGMGLTALALFALFVRFGGSFTYAHSLHWENCAMAQDPFLNEMILDDVQALYRGYSIQERITKGTASGIDQKRIREYLAQTARRALESGQLEDAFLRQARGPRIAKPKQIFILIGESYAQWPLLDRYAELHLGDGVRSLIAQPNTAYLKAFLPNGAFTPMAANAIISGLSDVNIYPNQQQESYRGVYKTALAPQLKALGYKTCFWYAGFSAWERMRDFALAQGFDEFHSASDFPYARGNVWGCDDEYLFAALDEYAQAETEPTVHVVLTVSNHAPYSVDLVKAGFDQAAVRAALPEEAKANKDLLKRLGHYWYTDQMIASFVRKMEERQPSENLFIITGDHAERTNINKQPTLFERSSVPFILHGKGIHPGLFPNDAAGGHVNIGATLIELIAPKDFVYYALGESLMGESKIGFNQNLWISSQEIGRIDAGQEEALPGFENMAFVSSRQVALETVRQMRTISWWRTMKGNKLE